MPEPSAIFLAVSFFFIALIYATVGQTGSSSYIAIMALLSVAPEQMKPAALAINILVSSITTFQFLRYRIFCRRSFTYLAFGAFPFAFWGGSVVLPDNIYLILTGTFLIAAAARAFYSASDTYLATVKRAPKKVLISLGALLGYLSGLTGIGGAIFLAPIFTFFHWADARTISGITSTFVLLNSSIALIGFLWANPHIRVEVPAWIIGAALGGFIGAELGTRHLKVDTLHYIRGCTLLLAGGKLITSAL